MYLFCLYCSGVDGNAVPQILQLINCYPQVDTPGAMYTLTPLARKHALLHTPHPTHGRHFINVTEWDHLKSESHSLKEEESIA